MLFRSTPTTEKIPATAAVLCRILIWNYVNELKDRTRSTYPVTVVSPVCGKFATTAVVVINTPSPFVVVLQIVTSGGVVITCDPFELVVVKTTRDERVEVGGVVIVLVSLLEDVAGTITSDR